MLNPKGETNAECQHGKDNRARTRKKDHKITKKLFHVLLIGELS